MSSYKRSKGLLNHNSQYCDLLGSELLKDCLGSYTSEELKNLKEEDWAILELKRELQNKVGKEEKKLDSGIKPSSASKIYSWRTYSENFKDDKNRPLSEEKHSNANNRSEKPWFYRRERRLSLEAVGAGVKLFNTSVNKPLSVDTSKSRKLVKDFDSGLWKLKTVYASESEERPKIPYRDMHGFMIIKNLEMDSPLLKMPTEKAENKIVERKSEATKYWRDWAFLDPRTGPSIREFSTH